VDHHAPLPHEQRCRHAARTAARLGLESDKFDKAALDAHFDTFIGALLREIGPRKKARHRLDDAPHRQLGDGRAELDRGFRASSYVDEAMTRCVICRPSAGGW